MGTTAVIDVVIGLILMYLLLSLVCTIINEFIASIFELRAGNLKEGITKIIDDPNLRAALTSTDIFKMAGCASGKKGPSYIPSKTFALGLLDVLDPKDKSTVNNSIEDVKKAIENLPESSVKTTLTALARDSKKDLNEYREDVSAWFDDMMDRLGGTYKRKIQMISLGTAVVLVVIANADSVQIATALWKDQTMREVVAQSATELVANNSETGKLKKLAKINDELRPFPIGWNLDFLDWSEGWCQIAASIFSKMFGLAFTALAVSLGAPFWFDLLSKFTKLRGSGGSPARQPDKAKETI